MYLALRPVVTRPRPPTVRDVSLQYRKSKSLGNGTRLNVSRSGLSVSKRVGPLTLNSRGRGSLRIAPGLSYRFGSRKKNDPTSAIIGLAILAIAVGFMAAIALLRIALILTVWLARWAIFGAQALIRGAVDHYAEKTR